MNLTHTALISLGILLLLPSSAAFGQAARGSRALPSMLPAATAPTITISAAASGGLLRSEGAGNASLDLGRVSYFREASTPGESSRRNSGSVVISTRFLLQVDCPGSPSFFQVNVTVLRTDAAASHSLAIDGVKLGSSAQPFAQSMSCGSSGEHRLDVEVPLSTPAGSIASTVAFEATLRR
jgi:hypothetical protein